MQLPSPITEINLPLLKEKGIHLFLKRDDLIHPIISGNKWRKLKYNLIKARKENQKTVLTFGGAYSNHIVATASACRENGFNSISVIRGDEGTVRESSGNATLNECIEFGMQLHFISREEYKRKNEKKFIDELKSKFGDFYLIPEGGANYEGILGCKEILPEENASTSLGNREVYDYICCAAGTGTTLSGLLLSLRENEKLLGFPALKIPSDKSTVIKGEFLKEEIEKNIQTYFPLEQNKMNQLELICDYHFGGYAKVNDELKSFVSDFLGQTGVQLDLIYNGKLFFGLMDLIKKDKFAPGTRILAVHTGGTQGNRGFL